jgi:hypothetical protein
LPPSCALSVPLHWEGCNGNQSRVFGLKIWKNGSSLPLPSNSLPTNELLWTLKVDGLYFLTSVGRVARIWPAAVGRSAV